jgi:hypothetical protein
MNEPLKVPEDLEQMFEASKLDTTMFVGSDIRFLIMRIARLTAELQAARARVETLSRPVSDEEVFKHRSHAQNGGFGTKDGLLNKDAISALIASRVAPEGERHFRDAG